MESPVKETSFESDADSIIDLVSTEEKVEVPELLEEAKVAYEEEAPKAEVVFEAISEVKKLVEVVEDSQPTETPKIVRESPVSGFQVFALVSVVFYLSVLFSWNGYMALFAWLTYALVIKCTSHKAKNVIMAHLKGVAAVVEEETESEYLISMELIQKYVFYVVGFINAAIQKIHNIFTLNDIKAAFKLALGCYVLSYLYVPQFFVTYGATLAVTMVVFQRMFKDDAKNMRALYQAAQDSSFALMCSQSCAFKRAQQMETPQFVHVVSDNIIAAKSKSCSSLKNAHAAFMSSKYSKYVAIAQEYLGCESSSSCMAAAKCQKVE